MKNPFPAEIMGQTFESHFFAFNTRSTIIYQSVLIFIILVLLSFFWIETDIIILARGIIRSSEENIQINSPVMAEVEWTNLQENMMVSKGDTLIRLNSSKLSSRIGHLDKLIMENQSFIADIEHLLSGNFDAVSTTLFNAQGTEFLQKLREYDLNISYLYKIFQREHKLFVKQVIAATDFEESGFQYQKMSEDREIYRHFKISEWQRMSTDFHVANEKYRAEMNELKDEMQKYTITAPFDGHIIHYAGIKSGSIVATGQMVAMISPVHDLLTETFLHPKDVGYLHSGMPVIYQVDAYNHNLWGLATGEVVEISESVYMIDNQPHFRVLSSIKEPHLSLENGYTGLMKKGLTATVRFRVSRRTVARLITDKAGDWLNPQVLRN
jgi:membrane fusion protein, peptide pheromone/bacteriocin exporter